MTTYYVWERATSTREFARTINAAESAESAAILYAELDHDGLAEGLYDSLVGTFLCVLAEGETEPKTFKVVADWDPVFMADEV